MAVYVNALTVYANGTMIGLGDHCQI